MMHCILPSVARTRALRTGVSLLRLLSPARETKCRLVLAVLLLSVFAPCRLGGQVPASGLPPAAQNARRPTSDADLRRWLENMIWYHRYSIDEVSQATGFSPAQVRGFVDRFQIFQQNRPRRAETAKLLVLPYPGGRHPRIGFLDGAVNPQRETKVSVFTPWDPNSYVVLDIPEAIWSNLGLTYLAHTHVPTLWTRQGIELNAQEWQVSEDGDLWMERRLPNGIKFGTKVMAHQDHVLLEMWLNNGTDEALSDLRVQNCAMLKGAEGFNQQTNDNKLFWGPYAACHSTDGRRWLIHAWQPIDRPWANAPCPCLHADPKFPDCPPAETRRIRGWFSFYEGVDIQSELHRIESTGWRRIDPSAPLTQVITGRVMDQQTGQLLPARIHLQGADGRWHRLKSVGGSAVHYDKRPARAPRSVEVHTTLSADPFQLELPAGNYHFRIERGKEYVPLVRDVEVKDRPLDLTFPLIRWINMSDRGWYSGDTHVHRSLNELPNVMLAEDLNVALPLTYWVTQAHVPPNRGDKSSAARDAARLIQVDDQHVIYPMNTEYEIFTVQDRSHTLGAVFVLNQTEELKLSVPPVSAVAREARRQGALLDLDKHSWPWSLMLVPVMEVDLFELANNHLWQTEFGFTQWTVDKVPESMQIQFADGGLTEWGWLDFGMKTYYALLNCGFPMRVTAGTASGVHPVQLGFGRVYVHLPDGFDYRDWMAGLDAGRTFVTTGPMLEVTFNEHPPGHTFLRDDHGAWSLTVAGVGSSSSPLDRIEIVVNGDIFVTLQPANSKTPSGGHASPFTYPLTISESSWIAVRCFQTSTDGRIRFAHTNPVHVQIPGRPLQPRKTEVDYFVRRMEEELHRNQGVLGPEALSEYQRALEMYRALLPAARQD